MTVMILPVHKLPTSNVLNTYINVVTSFEYFLIGLKPFYWVRHQNRRRKAVNESPVVAAFKTTYVLQESLKSPHSQLSVSPQLLIGENSQENNTQKPRVISVPPLYLMDTSIVGVCELSP